MPATWGRHIFGAFALRRVSHKFWLPMTLKITVGLKTSNLKPGNLQQTWCHDLPRGCRVGLALSSVAYNVVSNSAAPIFLGGAQNDVDIVDIMEYLKSPQVYRCHHCGHQTYLDSSSPADRCVRCHSHLKAGGDWVHFGGTAGVLQLPYASET